MRIRLIGCQTKGFYRVTVLGMLRNAMTKDAKHRLHILDFAQYHGKARVPKVLDQYNWADTFICKND